MRVLLGPFRFGVPLGVETRDPWRAAFLSLLPGAGQVYNFQPQKALLFVAVWTFLALFCVLTFFKPFSNMVLAGFVLWAAYAFHDGYRTARRINRDPWHLRLSIAYYVAWIFQISVFLLLAQYTLGFTVLKFRYMSEPALAPVLRKGERFGVDILSYRFRKPRVGEIVYYRPGQITLDAGANMYIERPLNGLERIVAGPGQVFERRGGEYFLDGVKAPPESRPIDQTEVNWDYRIEAPSDCYIVIRSHTSRDALSFTSPRMNEVLAVDGWEEACLVRPQEMIGRVLFIYQPPERRRWL